MTEKLAVPLDEGGVIIGSPRSHMFELARTGKIKTFKDGRRRKVTLDELRAHLQRLQDEQAGKGMSAMGEAGRAVLAAKREQEREARLAVEAAAKPSRRKGGRQ